MTATTLTPDARPAQAVTLWMTLLLAFACGLIAANIYYAQPLAGPIGVALGLSPGATGHRLAADLARTPRV